MHPKFDVDSAREILSRNQQVLRARIDHDVVDGAPAARFIARLAELVENAFGLATMSENDK